MQTLHSIKMSNGSSTGPLRKLKLFVAPDLPLHHRVISWLEFMWEDGNKMSRRCVCACTVRVCSHRVSGVVDNSAQRRGRESLPPQTLMSRLISCRHSTRKTKEGGKKTCSFERAAFVLAGGLSHYMQNSDCANRDCVSFKLIKVGATSIFQ